MRERRASPKWLQLAWPLVCVVVCGCFPPLLFALGQAPNPSPPDEEGPRAQFGPVRAVDDKVAVPGSEKSKQPDNDAKKKKPDVGDKDGGVLLYDMPVSLPNPDLLFRLDPEEMFRDRLRAEVRKHSPKVKLEFPDADPSVPVPHTARDWPDYVKVVEPSYVVSKRLFFEQSKFERYGENLRILQPGVSVGIFCFDLLLWPTRRMAHPFQCYQVNTDCYSPYFYFVRD